MEKIKRENSLYHHNAPITSTLSMPAPPLTSPSIYSGPPPPYSYPSSAASSTIGGERVDLNSGHRNYISPPETRRTSGDEKEQITSHKHSLPSITEALSSEQQPISISSLLSNNTSRKPPAVAQSPTSPTIRDRYPNTLTKGPSGPCSHYTPSSFPPTESVDRTSRPAYSPTTTTSANDVRYPAHISLPPVNASDHYHSTQPPRAAPSPNNGRPGASPIQHNRALSPILDRDPRTAAPTIDTSLSYNNYPPAAYSFPPTTPGAATYRTPTLQQQPSWPQYSQQDRDRENDVRKAVSKGSPSPTKPAYGESVKRHLDIFDLESSLNEVSPTSAIL